MSKPPFHLKSMFNKCVSKILTVLLRLTASEFSLVSSNVLSLVMSNVLFGNTS